MLLLTKAKYFTGFSKLKLKLKPKIMAMAITFSLVLSSCGYQLRGYQNNDLFDKNSASDLPVNILIEAPKNSDKNITYQQFNKHFRQSLQAVNITSNVLAEEDVNALLTIGSLDFSSQGISRDRLGRANEFNLYLQVNYQIKALNDDQESWSDKTPAENLQSQQQVAVNQQKVAVNANYFFDPERPTAGALQKRRTEKELLKQIAEKLSHQLASQLSPKLLD